MQFKKRNRTKLKKELVFYLENENKTILASSTVALALDTGKFSIPSESFDVAFCSKISDVCGAVNFIPESSKLVMEYPSFCNLVKNSDFIVTSVADSMGIEQSVAVQQAHEFFSANNLVVSPVGFQGKIYKMGSAIQSYLPAGYVGTFIMNARLIGAEGVGILSNNAGMYLALPTVGSLFFYGCGVIAGNNVIGQSCNTAGYILSRPMAITEHLWNNGPAVWINKTIGIPIVLNQTKALVQGSGYSYNEVKNFIGINHKSLLEKGKNWVIRRLGGKVT